MLKMIELKISKEGSSYVGKGRAKLGIAEVAIRCSSGYRSFNITASDDAGKTVNLDDLKKIGFDANSTAIEVEYNRLLKEFKQVEDQQRQDDRGKKFDGHPVHWISREMKKIGFTVDVSPNRDVYAKEWSERLQLSCAKNNIKILITWENTKWEVREYNDYENIKKTTKWNKAITLADEAYCRKFDKNREKTILNDMFETERLRLTKELGIHISKSDQSHSYTEGRRMKYTSYPCYLVEIDVVDPATGKSEKNQIKFRSSVDDGISIISFSRRIQQDAFAMLINKTAGKIIANEIPVKEPSQNLTGSRKLNPIG